MNTFTDLINRAHTLLQDHIKPQGVKILSLVGLLVLTTKTLTALNSFRRTFLPIGYNLPQRYGQGSYALITGGAQGIGAAFALELASKGFNLILIDLNEAKLNETKSLVNTSFPNITVKTITCNFADSWKEGFYDSLMEQIQGLDISLLVNNVGRGASPGPIHMVPEEAVLATITVNVMPTTILTRRLIPQMMKRTHRSGIINIASITGAYVFPWLAVYGATKAYVDFFTRAIERDVQEKIDVLSVRPSAVSTALLRNPKLNHYVISGQNVVQSSLRKLGNTTYTFGHWKHEIAGWLNATPFLHRLSARYFFESVLGMSNYNH